MLIIGIDPGKSNGGVAVYSTKTKTWNLGKERDEQEWKDLFSQWQGEDVLIGIEKQMLREVDKGKPSFFGIQKLVQRTERMIGVLRALDLPVVEIYPVSWQSPFRKQVEADKRDKKHVFQELACQLVGKKVALWGSDAVLIAYFVNKKLHEDRAWIDKRMLRGPDITIFDGQ